MACTSDTTIYQEDNIKQGSKCLNGNPLYSLTTNERESNVITTHIYTTPAEEMLKYCRLCAKVGGGNLLGIFGHEGEQHDIAEKISRCLPIIVFPMDCLPPNICLCCLEKLNSSYKLVITALKAEARLKTKFHSCVTNEHCQSPFDAEQTNCIKEDDNFEVKEEQPTDENGGLLPPAKIVDEEPCPANKICAEKVESHMDVEMIHKKKTKLLKCKTELVTEQKNADLHRQEVQNEIKIEGAGVLSLDIYGPAVCDICDVTFTDMNKFDEHVSSQHFMKWQCRLCDESFLDSAELLAHKVVEHSNNLVCCERCSSDGVGDNGDEEVAEELPDVTWQLQNKCKVKSDKQCKLCDKVLPTESKLKEHYAEHEPHGTVCSVCGVQCSSAYNLMLHRQQKHPKEDWYSCSRCSKMFSSRIALFIHKKHHCPNGKKTLECNICDRIFFRENSLQLHLKAHVTGKKQYTCDCGETFEWFEAFQTHKKSHKKPVSMECVTCHKVFTNETFYKRHRYIHDPEFWDRFKCQTCQRPFRDAQALSNHMQLHMGVKPHMCDLCGRTYNRYANMLKHRKLHKPPNQWEHKCNQCEATYERMKDLMSHIERSHNAGEPPAGDNKNGKNGGKLFKWICRFCGKRISTKLSLQDHERIHTGLKPYICEWCGREFRSRPNLLQHHLTHTGDRKHACDVCGKRFARKSFITQHMRVHTGEKPFECNVCGHRFTQAGDMRRHRRRHVDVKVDYLMDAPAQEEKNFLLKMNA